MKEGRKVIGRQVGRQAGRKAGRKETGRDVEGELQDCGVVIEQTIHDRSQPFVPVLDEGRKEGREGGRREGGGFIKFL